MNKKTTGKSTSTAAPSSSSTTNESSTTEYPDESTMPDIPPLASDRDKLGQKGFGQGPLASMNLVMKRGYDFIKDGRLNKGFCYTIEERQKLRILGLIPPAVKTTEEEIARCKANMDRLNDPLDKYIYLSQLQETNERLFYQFVSSNIQSYMPIVYTPTVGLACQNFSLIFQKAPRGLYITIHDKGHVYEVLQNWPVEDVRAIVVTDGERILGLGDLGANGMGIPIGKLSLYTALGGVNPHHCLPICLDVGTNTEKILNDPHYIGLRRKRVNGKEYEEFVDEFVNAVVTRFGMNTLIQFEDFANKNAFKFLERYRDQFCVFNDDIQGTSAVVVAGIKTSLRLTQKKFSENIILFLGAGEAATGIANLSVMAMVKEGVTKEEAANKIWMFDVEGLWVQSRLKGNENKHKALFAKDSPPQKDFFEAVKIVKPSILIGAASVSGAFTAEILKYMAENNPRPVIFALSNPTEKAECTAEQAYTATDGKAIFASGSPMKPFSYNGKTYETGQANNSYIFPGVSQGLICGGVKNVTDDMFLAAAETLADLVTDQDLDTGRIYPPLKNILQTSLKISTAVMEKAYETGLATTFPEPCEKEDFIKCQMYCAEFHNMLPAEYSYPSK